MRLRANIFLLLFVFSFSLYAQKSDSIHANLFEPSKTFNKTRRNFVVGAEIIGGTGIMLGLDQLWYAHYPRSSFHFFNDNDEWLQMDKMGHAQTSYSVGQTGYNVLKWAGVKDRNALWAGGTLGLMFTSVVEVMDGFSTQWGFSLGDFAADASGTLLFVGQQALWHEQRIKYKWTFMPSPYAQYRPNVLGKDLSQQWLKDYNGQTYWFSVNVASFLPEQSKYPKWLNLALGYGADGMTGGSENPLLVNGQAIPYFDRSRQFYLSFDIDFNQMRIKNKFLKSILSSVGFIKIPAPALEFSPGRGVFLHPLFF